VVCGLVDVRPEDLVGRHQTPVARKEIASMHRPYSAFETCSG
jgi:hypothetical protein